MLFRKLPEEICKIKIQTDYRKWIKIAQILDAPLTPLEKKSIVFYNLFGEISIKPGEVEMLMESIMDFYLCGQKVPPGIDTPPEKLLDWERDSDAIWADFKIYAGMDLDKESLHWWEFMALFQSLPESAAIRRRMETRAIDLSKIKDPETREEYRKRKLAVTLEDTNSIDF